ncbi:MAG: hypothetical protein PVF58_07385 [Candidatus Methanofastidiosia archaeon]|jgi:hypothetical protein
MQFKKEVVEALKREIKICDIGLSKMKRRLQEFEVKYQMSTEEFSKKFEKGQLSDDQGFFEWNAYIEYYKDWQNRKEALE